MFRASLTTRSSRSHTCAPQSTIGNLRRDKKVAEERCEEVNKELAEVKREVLIAEDKGRREVRDAVGSLQEQIEKLESEVIRLEDGRKRMEVEHRGMATRVNRECEAARSDCQRIAREKEAMAIRSASVADKCEVLKGRVAELEDMAAVAEKSVSTAKSSARRLEKESSELKTDNAELVRRIEFSSEDVARLSSALDKVREDNIVNMNDMKKTIEKDRQALKEKLKEEVAKYKSKLGKEVKRSEAYKEKALEAHQKGVRARNALSSVANANELYGAGGGAGGGM